MIEPLDFFVLSASLSVCSYLTRTNVLIISRPDLDGCLLQGFDALVHIFQ